MKLFKTTLSFILCLALVFSLAACGGAKGSGTVNDPSGSAAPTAEPRNDTTPEPSGEAIASTEENNLQKDSMVLRIGETVVPVTWEDNASVDELRSLLPLTIPMSIYGGFEQVGSIGQGIISNDSRITTEPGDIVLYSGNRIVIFYGSNTWAYTKLGHVDLSEREMKELLSNGDVNITISKEG